MEGVIAKGTKQIAVGATTREGELRIGIGGGGGWGGGRRGRLLQALGMSQPFPRLLIKDR